MATLKPPVTSADQSTGNVQSAIILVEYGDYQCPHCGHAHPLVKKLIQEKGDTFRFVFRNFPLQESHPAAFISACAAEAAGLQGKFWEMHDLIFENQRGLSPQALLRFAEEVGLDLDQYQEDIESSEITQKVEDDFESGIRSGVNGTPTFFINGAIVQYDTTYQSLLRAVEAGR